MSKAYSAIAVQLVDLLEPLASEDRKRVVKAAFVLLGEESASTSETSDEPEIGGEELPISPKARLWAKQNGISVAQLANLFHAEEGKFDIIIGEMPGNSNKEKVRNTYLLKGLAQLLETGAATFDDKTARSLCDGFGCYDSNHSKIKFGNELNGSAAKGWSLTAPGLKQVAALVSDLSKAND